MTIDRVKELRESLDLSYHLSEEGKLRRVSPLKGLAKYNKPENICLAQGISRPDNYALQSPKFNYKKFEKNYKSIQYNNNSGSLQLKEFLRDHMIKVHTSKYSNWDIILTTGNTHSLYQSLTLLTNLGDPIIVSKWDCPSALETFRGKGLRLLICNIDEQGLIPESIEKVVSDYHENNPMSPKCRMVYTVPTGQNPTGATMSLKRRQEFYNTCKKLDLMILEDDLYYFLQLPTYNSESNYNESEFTQSTLLPSLYSLDTDGRVIRMDSFSKVMGPGFRTAWTTGPKWYTDKLEFLNEVSNQEPSGLSQSMLVQILTQWGQEGFINHLNRISKEFTQCRDKFVACINDYLGDKVIYKITEAGMFGWIKLNSKLFNIESGKEEEFRDLLFSKLTQVNVVPVPGFYFDSQSYNINSVDTLSNSCHAELYLRLCYNFVDTDQLIEGIKRISQILNEISK